MKRWIRISRVPRRAISRMLADSESSGKMGQCRRSWSFIRLNVSGHPLGNILLLGPTGVGKTRIVEAAAEILFGDERAIIKVDCAEFQHSHEISKLIGSPPGYLKHRERHPLTTQEALARNHRGELKLSFLLFDEIEKASDALWQLLLGVLDKATLTLGDNRRVDLSQTIIFMTSNLGAVQITELMTGRHGICSSIRRADEPSRRKNGTGGNRCGTSKVFPGVRESLGQAGSVSSLEARTIAGSASDRAPKGSISC